MYAEFSRNWSKADKGKIASIYNLLTSRVVAKMELPFSELLTPIDEIIGEFGLRTEDLSLQSVVALFNEICIYAEVAWKLPSHSRHYLRDVDIYLKSMDKLPDELKSPGNTAVLLGCGNLVSAFGFIATVREVSPYIKPVIVDINVDHFRELKPDLHGGSVVRMNALQTGFATGSVAIVQSNYVGDYIHGFLGNDGIRDFLEEARRIIHPQGALGLLEEERHFA